MRHLSRFIALFVPLVAVLASASYASADRIIAYLEGVGLSAGTSAFNCNLTNSKGARAHIQSMAFALNPTNRSEIAVSMKSGTSQGETVMLPPGLRHRVELQSHLFDFDRGEESLLVHCSGGWTSGWLSQGTTNVSQCSRSLRVSLQPSGSCTMRTFNAASMGAD